MPEIEALIAVARKKYHEKLLHTGTLAINANGVATNADKDRMFVISLLHSYAVSAEAEGIGGIGCTHIDSEVSGCCAVEHANSGIRTGCSLRGYRAN